MKRMLLLSRSVGRTRLFMFNPRYAFLDELKAFLEKARSYYSIEKELEFNKKNHAKSKERRKNSPLF